MRRTLPLAALAAVLTFASPSRAAVDPPDAGPRPDSRRPPGAVLDLARRAQAKITAREWKDAAALLEEVVRLNPVNPNHWYSLGFVRYQAKDYKGAIPAYEKAAEVGAPLMGAYYAVYNTACCHALAGEKEAAVAALQRAFELGFPNLGQAARDPDLVAVHDDPRVVELLALRDVSKMSRDEGWRNDLAVLAREVHRKGFNPRLDVNRTVSREQFDQKVRQLHDAIPELSDGRVILELMKVMVFLDDGHTAVWPVGEHPLFRASLPLRFFWFEEGLYVTAAEPRHKGLLGCRVVTIDGRPAEEVLEGTAPYINRDRGNPIKTKVSAPYAIRKVGVLHAAGLAKRPDRVTLTVRDQAGTEKEVDVAADAKEAEIWNTLPAPATCSTTRRSRWPGSPNGCSSSSTRTRSRSW